MVDSKPIVSSSTKIFNRSKMLSKAGRISSPVIMLGELNFVTSAYNSRVNRLRKVAILFRTESCLHVYPSSDSTQPATTCNRD